MKFTVKIANDVFIIEADSYQDAAVEGNNRRAGYVIAVAGPDGERKYDSKVVEYLPKPALVRPPAPPKLIVVPKIQPQPPKRKAGVVRRVAKKLGRKK